MAEYKLYLSQILEIHTTEEDRLLHLKDENCGLYKSLLDYAKNSAEKRKILEFRTFLLWGLQHYYNASISEVAVEHMDYNSS